MRENRNKDDRRQAKSNDQHKRCILETKKETVYNKVYGYRISKRRLRNINNKHQKIVTVTGNKNGTCKIKAGSKIGKATITIKLASGLTKQIKVTVQKKAVTCTRIKNVPKTINLKKKQTYQLKPMIEPITCTDKAKYKSSNKKTAKVTTSGKLTAVKKGKTKVTVVVGKKKFACTVNVR